MVPSYFTLAVRLATPSFVYVSYLHELFSSAADFQAACFKPAAGSQTAVGKKRLLCSEGFCAVVKKPLHFLYVQHGRATKWTYWKLIKIHRFTEQFIIPSSSSPRPLGLEVTAAYDKRARSFINVRFSIHPTFWKSLNLHEYFISEGRWKKSVPWHKLH